VVQPSGKYHRTISTRQAFRGVLGAFSTEWEVFTHTRDNVTRLYARYLLHRKTGRKVCVAIGVLAGERGINFLSDEKGTLHVLYLTVVRNESYYAHDTVTRDLEASHRALFQADDDRIPTFSLKVNVEGAKEIPADAAEGTRKVEE